MPAVPVETRARLLTDRGSGYLAGAFEDYLRTLHLRHIYCAPHHPQANGKLERFHETLKARLNLLVYTSPERLRTAMADFIRFYNHARYHEGIGNVTPADVYGGRREAILRRRAHQRTTGSARPRGVPQVLTTDSDSMTDADRTWVSGVGASRSLFATSVYLELL